MYIDIVFLFVGIDSNGPINDIFLLEAILIFQYNSLTRNTTRHRL